MAKYAAGQRTGLSDVWALDVEGGRGGDGCVSFARSGGSATRGGSLRNFGRPSGGDGGRGANIWIEASDEVSDLGGVATPLLRGRRGQSGRGDMVRGKDAEDTVLRVPLGTVVRRLPRSTTEEPDTLTREAIEAARNVATEGISLEHEAMKAHYVFYPGWEDRGEILEWEKQAARTSQGRRLLEQIGRRPSTTGDSASSSTVIDVHDMIEPGQRVLVATGGQGGHGNRWFATRDRPPAKFASRGLAGEQCRLELELKQLAQVGLVGAPNVGKSTLLRAMTRARPAVASYAFTTIRPGIGVLAFEDGLQIRIADIPGLVEGAAEDRGLGLTFLRHVERTRLLLLVVDLTSNAPWCGLDTLVRELSAYKADLLQRPVLLVANKADAPQAKQNWDRWWRAWTATSPLAAIHDDLPEELASLRVQGVMAISALEQKNTERLARQIRQLVTMHE
ncbi:P-loop containing nucleoside triphosphate hydrolase protein [Syncephalis pseudoplumigaleata]|uniref:P-loop containing nucleoside triphosphate hydrolase protein n=1 Tax=Syncephalis pseudoplumigaleata TaxID=1712513 RepID=A0A4P9Z764_9FUNG|nr:P-loop containing nucleoside triphosphate hydrolase protein [Syncephalis pseudoplumigaleata]|eukprot:RKP27721.1 P-loop containing nucleoside triphosphate hydrolase protein [Syncephalis pseudoplumigaleata]